MHIKSHCPTKRFNSLGITERVFILFYKFNYILAYQEVRNKWNYIDSLENQKYTLSNKYYSDVEKENSLHASNLSKINALRY